MMFDIGVDKMEYSLRAIYYCVLVGEEKMRHQMTYGDGSADAAFVYALECGLDFVLEAREAEGL